MSTRAAVAVIGAGASGTLAAAHLARAAATAQTPLDILLIDPAPPGQGLAYCTDDPRHRLNVPAQGMSAWPDDPAHFLRWLRRHVALDYPAGGFAPRLHYAQYLAHVLDQASRAAPDVQVQHVASRVTDLRRHGSRTRITLSDGTSRAVDAAVLALGYGQPSTEWAPPALREWSRFVADPWRVTDPPAVRHGEDIVVVGASLTAADMVQRWGREGVRVHVVARHGMLPLPHAPAPSAPLELNPGEPSPAELRRFVFRAVRDADGDWRAVVDGLRPHTQRVWRTWNDRQRRTFLDSMMRHWDRVRHRIDPTLHEWLQLRRTDGSLVVHAASVVDAEVRDDRMAVTLSDGTVVRAAVVLNCTGTCTGISLNNDPLLLNLLSSGLARPGPLDLGFATDEHGRLATADAAAVNVWTLGPLRRGELWESTAVPEIRGQAAALAQQVLAALPSRHVHRRPRDPYGLPISASSSAAAAYTEALGRILRVQSGAETLLADAVRDDPGFALGQAVLALLGTEWGVQVDADAALSAAESRAARADERERRFVEVAAARVREPGPESAAALLTYIHEYPEDALAVSLAVPTIAFGGATEIPAEAWALVDGLAPAYGEDWWYLGLLAFIRQEQDRFAEAAHLSVRALSIEPSAGHAVHAKAHVHYETGDHRAGLSWLDQWIDTCGARASHRAHFSWHAALHELALCDDEAVLRRYRAQLSAGTVTGVRALVDSASLLWRMRVVGGASHPGMPELLAGMPEDLLTRPATPFIALHAAVALAAVDDCRRLAQLRRWSRGHTNEVFAQTITGLVDALSDVVHGATDRATDVLAGLSGLDRVGGSAAQREIVAETLLFCAIDSGNHAMADEILAQRLARRDSPRDRRRLQQLHSV